MGYGTGVLRFYFAIYFLRGLSVGIAGTGSLFIARRTGVQQRLLIAGRGIGMIGGPMIFSRTIGKMAWSGESQYTAALGLALKGFCDLLVSRSDNAFVLYSSFFTIGIAMSLLDTLLIILVTSAVKENPGALLSSYDACYGIGGMLAPMVTVAMPSKVWDLLSAIDFCLAACIAVRRYVNGKPRNWRDRIQGTGKVIGMARIPVCESPCPGRVVRTGVAFTVVSQMGATAVSAWGFTFAVQSLSLPDVTAAVIPSAFYLSSTVTRFIVVYFSPRMVPSAVIHVSVLVLLAGALPFRWMSSQILGMATLSQLGLVAILASFMLMGAGYCPHYSFMLVSMARHGHLDARLNGWYATSCNLGIALGLWLPSLFSLANVQVLCAAALLLILNSRIIDFPWREVQVLVRPVADA